jgi:hypothetical protein
MVDMHQFFIDKIDDALEEERFIEASWLIYACIENRFFRVLQKYKHLCSKCTGKCRKNRNELALSTKRQCVERLREANVTCISESFSKEQLENIKDWVKRRNTLMHNLLSLESYQQSDNEFRDIALQGRPILDELYSSCTKFRSIFYQDGYEFYFPQSAMDACSCGKTKETDNTQ